jgi:hypothetical protein
MDIPLLPALQLQSLLVIVTLGAFGGVLPILGNRYASGESTDGRRFVGAMCFGSVTALILRYLILGDVEISFQKIICFALIGGIVSQFFWMMIPGVMARQISRTQVLALTREIQDSLSALAKVKSEKAPSDSTSENYEPFMRLVHTVASIQTRLVEYAPEKMELTTEIQKALAAIDSATHADPRLENDVRAILPASSPVALLASSRLLPPGKPCQYCGGSGKQPE